jgi:dipeptidyl aminopeptidase/acylaminoacyl peptidase
VRSLDQLAGRVVEGTEDAEWCTFSPDARSLLVYRRGVLSRVPLGVGSAVDLARTPMLGAAWTRDGRIIIGAEDREHGLRVLPPEGGKPSPLTRPDTTAGEYHVWPFLLRDGTHVAFIRMRNTEGVLAMAALEDGHVTMTSVALGGYSRIVGQVDDWLVFTRPDGVWAVRLRRDREGVDREPIQVLEGARPESVRFAEDGTLVYAVGVGDRTLEVVDSSGARIAALTRPAEYGAPRFAPDGRRLAFDVGPIDAESAIWIHDVVTGTSTKLVTSFPAVGRSAWMPDGRQLVYVARVSTAPAHYRLFVQPFDGRAPPHQLDIVGRDVLEASVARNGALIVARVGIVGAGAKTELWAIPLRGTGVPWAVLADPSTKAEPSLSPDGRWLAYRSDETGVPESFVRPVRGAGGRVQVSSGGGREPV